MTVAEIVSRTELVSTPGGSRRLVAQGGVRLNGERVGDAEAVVPDGWHEVHVGKRHFLFLVTDGDAQRVL